VHVGLSAPMHNFCSLKPLCSTKGWRGLKTSLRISSITPVAVDAAVPRNDPLRWGLPPRGGTIQLRWGERFASGGAGCSCDAPKRAPRRRSSYL
jgi:hypothetical protein